MTTLYSLESTISTRNAEILRKVEGKPSWTKKLLLDEKLLCSKIRLVFKKFSSLMCCTINYVVLINGMSWLLSSFVILSP